MRRYIAGVPYAVEVRHWRAWVDIVEQAYGQAERGTTCIHGRRTTNSIAPSLAPPTAESTRTHAASTHPMSLYSGPARAPRNRPRGAASTSPPLPCGPNAVPSPQKHRASTLCEVPPARHATRARASARLRAPPVPPRDGDGCARSSHVPTLRQEAHGPHLAPEWSATLAPLHLCPRPVRIMQHAGSGRPPHLHLSSSQASLSAGLPDCWPCPRYLFTSGWSDCA